MPALTNIPEGPTVTLPLYRGKVVFLIDKAASTPYRRVQRRAVFMGWSYYSSIVPDALLTFRLLVTAPEYRIVHIRFVRTLGIDANGEFCQTLIEHPTDNEWSWKFSNLTDSERRLYDLAKRCYRLLSNGDTVDHNLAVRRYRAERAALERQESDRRGRTIIYSDWDGWGETITEDTEP